LYTCADSIKPPEAGGGGAAAALALLSSFLNLIPHALHSDCNAIHTQSHKTTLQYRRNKMKILIKLKDMQKAVFFYMFIMN